MLSLRTPALALFAAGALFAAACETDDANDPADEPPVEEEQPGDASDLDEQPDQPEQPGIDVDPVRITYLAAMPDEEDEELIVSWDPPQVAVIFEGGKFIFTEEHGTVLCSEEDGEDVCSEIPGQGAGPEQLIQSFVPFFSAAGTGVQEIPGSEPTDDREIAGRDAECHLITPPEGPDVEEAGTAELCADVETGATLLYSFTDEAGVEQSIEAVEVEAPEPDDFEPTTEVTETEVPEDAPPADD